jgi:hypothetical protein
MGAHALARDAAGGMGSVEEGGQGAVFVTRFAVPALGFAALVSSCFVMAAFGDDQVALTKQLVGKWTCSTQTTTYRDGSKKTFAVPETIIEYFDDGRYTSKNAAVTHRGTYEVIDKEHFSIRISYANDARVAGISGTNTFLLTADTLRLITPARGERNDNLVEAETTCRRR